MAEETPESLAAFRRVPRTGVIYVTTDPKDVHVFDTASGERLTAGAPLVAHAG